MLIKQDQQRYDQFLMNQEKKRRRVGRMTGQLAESNLPLWLQADPDFRRKQPFESPEEMWEAAKAYFEWAAFSPIQEETKVQFRGVWSTATDNRPRALSMRAFASFVGTSVRKIEAMRTKEAFQDVLEVIDQIIYTQKFEYAAVNMMNAGLIAKDLGYAEKTELSGPDGGPIRTEENGEAARSFAQRMAVLAQRARGEDQ